MQTSEKASLSSKRWVYIYLYVLSELRKVDNGLCDEISKINDETLYRVSQSLKCKRKSLIIIEKFRCKKKFNKSDFSFIKMIISESKHIHPKLNFITDSSKFQTVIDDEFIEGVVSDEKVVLDAMHNGFDVINKVSPTWEARIMDTIETVCGIKDKKNIINSGFTKDFPGFISFNINCIPLVIGEQLVHESTHLMLDNIIFYNGKVRKFIQSHPPLYSIFAKKPRSTELLIHGLFSYTSVYLFWDKLLINRLCNPLMAKERKSQVIEYIENAVCNLDNILSENDWKKLKTIFRKICPLDTGKAWCIKNRKSTSKNQLLVKGTRYFNDVELAEIILSIHGNKVSRISKNVKELAPIVSLLNQFDLKYCFSNYLFKSSSDKNIDGFKNVITSIHNLDSHYDNELDIHIYIANSKKALKRAFILDQKDKCGSLFKIPICCQKYFKQNWDLAVDNYNGDLVRVLYNTNEFQLIGSELLYSPVSMYFDMGVCWHFTCKKNCSATKAIVDERIGVLRQYPYFNSKFKKLMRSRIDFSIIKGYKIIYNNSLN